MVQVLLSGASKGIGLEIYKIIKTCKKIDEIFLIGRKKYKSTHQRVKSISVDLGESQIIKQLPLSIAINSTVIFINNAGVIEPISKLIDSDYKEITHNFNINFFSPIQIAQYLAKETLSVNSNLIIINITSGASKRPIPGWTSYCASKSSMKIALDILDIENKHINVIHHDPGVFDTDMQKTIRSHFSDVMLDVNLFKDLADKKKLKSPAFCANEIYEILKQYL